jgi:carbamoylphosphate synthase large subunit
MKKILITSIGSLIGEAIIDALGSRRAEFKIIGTNSDPAAFNNFRADIACLVPASAEAEPFLCQMRRILQVERPDLVLAGRDGDLAALAVLQAEPELAATCFLTPPAALVEIVRDKYRTYEFGRAHRLPFAESAIDADSAERLITLKGLPLIAKPRAGHGSLGTSVVATRDQALAALAGGGTVLQEFLSPPPDLEMGGPDLRAGMPLHFAVRWQALFNATLLLDREGRVIFYNGTRVSLIAGKGVVIVPIGEPGLEQVARAYAAALGRLGLIGPLNVQCQRRSDGAFVAFEINLRFGGTTASRARLGFTDALQAIDHFLYGRQPPPPSATGGEGRFVVRRLIDEVVSDADICQLAGTGRWSAPPP